MYWFTNIKYSLEGMEIESLNHPGFATIMLYCPWFNLRNKSDKSLVFDSFDYLKINKENRNQKLYMNITVPRILLVLSCVYTIIIIMLMYFQTIIGQLSNLTQMMTSSLSSVCQTNSNFPNHNNIALQHFIPFFYSFNVFCLKEVNMIYNYEF